MGTNPYTRGYFESGEGSNYHGYGDDPGWAPTASILRAALPAGDPPPRLLELGSAKGYFLKAAQHEGIAAIGVDASPWAVAQTTLEVSPYNLLMDVTQLPLPFPRGMFDAVVSWEFLEHIEIHHMTYVLKSALYALRPGGLFVHRIALADAGMVDDDHTHVSVWTRGVWELLFAERGLDPDRELENKFRDAFRGRDWSERFFCYRKPPTAG